MELQTQLPQELFESSFFEDLPPLDLLGSWQQAPASRAEVIEDRELPSGQFGFDAFELGVEFETSDEEPFMSFSSTLSEMSSANENNTAISWQLVDETTTEPTTMASSIKTNKSIKKRRDSPVVHAARKASAPAAKVVPPSSPASMMSSQNSSQDFDEEEAVSRVTEHQCTIDGCGKYFSRRHNLKVHMRRHTGETPYSCFYQGCGKQFKWKSSLKYHQKLHLRLASDVTDDAFSS